MEKWPYLGLGKEMYKMILKRVIKMAEEGDAKFTSPKKHIKITSTRGTILTENK